MLLRSHLNANISIARRWLSKCGANVAACISDVVAKMLFTIIQALAMLEYRGPWHVCSRIHRADTC